MQYLYVKGCAGLGNRLITLLKAILYAKRSGRTLYVDWSDGMFADSGINAFYRYFDLKDVDYANSPEAIEILLTNGGTLYPKGITLKELKEGIYDNFWHVGTWFSWNVAPYRVFITLLLRGKITSVFGLQSWQHKYDEQVSWWGNIKRVYNEQNIQLGAQLRRRIDRDVVVFVDFRPLVKTSDIFNYVSLKGEYYKKFLKYAEQYNLVNHGIGIHIRATDKQPKKKLEKLLKCVDRMLSADRKMKVFLSTDNLQLTKEIQKRYSDRIVLYPKFLPEDLNGKGIHHWALEHNIPNIKERMFEESLADMWILSMCKYLFWQGNSSFSLMSSILKEDKENVVNWLKL